MKNDYALICKDGLPVVIPIKFSDCFMSFPDGKGGFRHVQVWDKLSINKTIVFIGSEKECYEQINPKN